MRTIKEHSIGMLSLTLVLVLLSCEQEGQDASPGDGIPCNGSFLLCEKRYDEVSYATSHNAMASEEDGYGGPNHLFGLTRQLEEGVRAWMLDVHPFQGGVSLCHGYCFFGERPLSDGLDELEAFLSGNPGAVVTLFFESYVSAIEIEEEFADSGVLHRVHTQRAGEPWPTLGEMVQSGRRLVVFTDKTDNGPDWYMDVWDHCWETDWSNTTVEDFDCQLNRGSSDNSLFILNHFLTAPIALQELAAEVNGIAPLNAHVVECLQETGQQPNFIAVDFFSVGGLFLVVDGLNGVPLEKTF